MIHVKDIQKMLQTGDTIAANSAIENLLSLGPKNTEALKLKASLMQMEGRYEEQNKIWQQIISIDPEDTEGILYFQRRFIDERENYYFTENIDGEGKRFQALPKSIVQIGMIGLVGCMIFLLLPRASIKYPQYLGDRELIIAFSILIVIPWILLIFTYIRSLRWVAVTKAGIEFRTKLRNHVYAWKDLKQIYICHSFEHKNYLGLLLYPSDERRKPAFLNLSEHDSAIKARPFLISEIRKRFPDAKFVPYEKIEEVPKRLLAF